MISIRVIIGKSLHHETVELILGVNLFMIKAYLAPGVYMMELMDDNYEPRLIKHEVNNQKRGRMPPFLYSFDHTKIARSVHTAIASEYPFWIRLI